MSKPTVFISYSHKDKKWVTEYLLANLEKNSIKCHIDFRDFEIGKPSLLCMEEAIEKCDKTILVYTPNWIESEFAQFEGVLLQTDSPLNSKKKIIPIMLENCDIPKRLKILNFADFADENEWDAQLQRVIKQINKDFEKTKPKKITYPALEAKHIDIKRLPQTGFELFGRHKELTLLNETWESGDTNIISFVAYGGVGKSTLVNKWVEKMRWDNYRGAEKVYAWSFYSQGTSERVTSADQFINHALEWFGDADPKKGSPWDKGKRLARLINTHKTLLLLDGMEPLQSAEKFEHGKIKDPALETLTKELAKNNNGLCIITTREPVPELSRYPSKTQQLNLELISDEAGRKLLETRRIVGSEKDLESIVRQFGNHALAINLLAEYLRLFDNHPLDKAGSIQDIDIADKQGRHARRIIEAFAVHFGNDSCEFQLLSMLGLFDRPVPVHAIQAIIGEKPIRNLSNKITDTCGSDWLKILEALRKHKLLFKESEHNPNTLDCHPLIREHFGDKLENENQAAWKEAHARLFEYYKSLPEKLFNKKLPDTLEEMEPLFAAVMHGCLAGKHKEAFWDVYVERIKRETEHYSTAQLGAYGADLSCISNFFETRWDRPVAGLTEQDKAVALNWAGFRLRAVGRLSEAAQPMKGALEMNVKQQNWKDAALDASNLSQLYLNIGNVASAQKYGAQGVDFADRSGNGFQMETKRVQLADAQYQAGENSAAQELFLEAENMQIKRVPDLSFLYGFAGFLFCDLLLSIGNYREAMERAQTTITWVRNLISIALTKLTISKALMLQTIDANSPDYKEAEEYLNQAVDGLRKAGHQQLLPPGLFSRATLFMHQTAFHKSWTDLDEAREIAEYGQMRLYLTDYHLEAARVIRAQVEYDKKSDVFTIIEDGMERELTREEMDRLCDKHVAEAERLIEETGYHRRDGELEELKR